MTASDEAPRCACGHDRTHFMVSPEGKYTAFGWFWLLFGVTTRPVRIFYRCRVCNQVFDETEDPATLDQHA